MNKRDILKRLEQTFCRIGRSKISGVGVIARRDILKNTNPFKGTRAQKWEEFHMKELEHLDKAILKMIDDFYVIEKENTVMIPQYALNGMDISFLLNHSKKPNLKTTDEGYTFVTLRKIKKGEELTVAYATYDYKYKE